LPSGRSVRERKPIASDQLEKLSTPQKHHLVDRSADRILLNHEGMGMMAKVLFT
jgi:hypothetical protein